MINVYILQNHLVVAVAIKLLLMIRGTQFVVQLLHFDCMSGTFPSPSSVYAYAVVAVSWFFLVLCLVLVVIFFDQSICQPISAT